MFEQRLTAQFVGMQWRKWLAQSVDMQNADVAFYRDYHAMVSARESERAKQQEAMNKPRAKGRRGK